MERKSRLRGALDLLSGAYPAFVWGGPVGRQLPVFHVHDVTAAYLEPYLAYLAENRYRTVTSEAVVRWVRDGVFPGDRVVVLCFDDAWTSLWTVAEPLLRQYGLRAITFAIPGRTEEAAGVRSAADDGAAPPFCTWPELQALHAGGVVDVQSHTYAHAKIFADDGVAGFISPGYASHLHDRPCIQAGAAPRFLDASALGAPLYQVRSRMSDALRYDDPGARDRAGSAVQRAGGAAFFQRANWETELRQAVGAPTGRYETEVERERAILEDLTMAREVLNRRLRTSTVKHLCFPWAVAGRVAVQCARRAGYESAWSDRLGGRHAVRQGDNPFRLMRLKHQYIYHLPGKGRRWMGR